jgi:hypothetical protein
MYGDTFMLAMISDTKIFKRWKYGEGYDTYTKQGSNSGPTPAPPTPTNSVVGAWICNQWSDFIIVFNSDGTGIWNDGDEEGDVLFTYTVSGNTITISKHDGPPITMTMNGNTIYWEEWNITFTKQ